MPSRLALLTYPSHMTDSANGGNVVLNGKPLRFYDVERVARQQVIVEVSPEVINRLDHLREQVETAAMGETAIYGVSTGFGSLSRVRIVPDKVREVQRNLIRSHAAGVGEPLSCDVVRAMMLILAGSLCRGHSGVRSALVLHIVEALNAGIVPIVPSRGSVGASGDLAPLSHIVLVLLGEGEARYVGKIISGSEALQSAGLSPIELEAKEGLALINGTHMMTAIGSLAMCDIDRILTAAIGSATLAIDACRGSDVPLDARIHSVRQQPGQIEVARQMRELLEGSQIVRSHKVDDPRVQDPYCLRASPQVLGAVFDTVAYVRNVIENELGAVTDNPLIFEKAAADATSVDTTQFHSSETDDLQFLSGGNFHGMPLAIALDTLSVALCHIAGIAERRINWLLTASDSENPVNLYLSPQPGLHSGLMIAQYTAAACCNELQTLASPASVGNISTSAGIEDYNSMGATAAHQVHAAVKLTRSVIAIELLVMSEALEYQRPLRSSGRLEQIHDTVRNIVPRLTEDRPPSTDISRIEQLIQHGKI